MFRVAFKREKTIYSTLIYIAHFVSANVHHSGAANPRFSRAFPSLRPPAIQLRHSSFFYCCCCRHCYHCRYQYPLTASRRQCEENGGRQATAKLKREWPETGDKMCNINKCGAKRTRTKLKFTKTRESLPKHHTHPPSCSSRNIPLGIH